MEDINDFVDLIVLDVELVIVCVLSGSGNVCIMLKDMKDCDYI